MQTGLFKSNEERRTRSIAFRTTILLFGLAIIILFQTGGALAQGVEPADTELADISAQLNDELRTTEGPVSFLVILKDQLAREELAEAAADLDEGSREVRLSTTYAALTGHATRTQAPLLDWLDSQGIAYRPFYIVNMVEVTGDVTLAEALRRRPEVDRLTGNPDVEQMHSMAAPVAEPRAMPGWLHAIEPSMAAASMQSTDLPYGLVDTGAAELWAQGYTGQGMVVASQDTGVEWSHPALQPRYRGWDADSQTVEHVANWYDYWELTDRPSRCEADAQVPCDDHGHGTHTVGTMLGNATEAQVQVGMAPDAQWIGCRNMHGGYGTPASYTACFEFFMAPYPQGGDPFVDGRPELAPHVVNNSWSCPPNEGCDADSLGQIVETVRAAGIFVVASAGNGGSGCETVDDPIAIYDATFSVGAHGSSGTIAGFSSRGPVTVDGSGRMKPDISAPGVAVYSTTTNGGYTSLQGTSMASPHVAGAAALLWSAVPELVGDIDLTEQALIKGALPVPAASCGEGLEETSPNNVFGYGRLNVLDAVELAQHPADIEVRIVEIGGLPAVGLTAVITDRLTGYRHETITDEAGLAAFIGLLAGDYHLAVTDGSATLVEAELTAEPDGRYDVSYTAERFRLHFPAISR